MKRPGVASRRAQRPTGERSKRRRDGRRRGELTGSQQVTASPSFYYLLSLLRSSGHPLPFPQPPSTTAICSPPPPLSLRLSFYFPSLSVSPSDSRVRIFPSRFDHAVSQTACLPDEQLKDRFARQQYRCIPSSSWNCTLSTFLGKSASSRD